jgi:hypothetical protein
LPHDDVDFSRVLDALTTRGFVVKYATDGSEFGFIPTFCRHQIINNRERDSELPAPPPETRENSLNMTREARADDASVTRDARVVDLVKRKGREGKGRRKGRRKYIYTELVDEHSPNGRRKFVPPSLDQVRAYCQERRSAVDPEAWMNHYQANGWLIGKNKMHDWKAAVRTWEKRATPPPASRVASAEDLVNWRPQ